MEQESKMTDPKIIEAERNGGGGMYQDKHLPCGHWESEECTCRQLADKRKEDENKDERNWK